MDTKPIGCQVSGVLFNYRMSVILLLFGYLASIIAYLSVSGVVFQNTKIYWTIGILAIGLAHYVFVYRLLMQIDIKYPYLWLIGYMLAYGVLRFGGILVFAWIVWKTLRYLKGNGYRYRLVGLL